MHWLLAREALLDRILPNDGADRRRFAFKDAGELWMSDVMHGRKVRRGQTRRKTCLIAFIDDATARLARTISNRPRRARIITARWILANSAVEFGEYAVHE